LHGTLDLQLEARNEPPAEAKIVLFVLTSSECPCLLIH